MARRLLLEGNLEIYSTQNEGKSVVAERFNRSLKDKIYKHMTAMPKNMYLDKSDRAIKMKPIDVNSNTYIGYILTLMFKK